MENRDFDDIIKKKLEEMTSSSTDDGWDMFKEKWDAQKEISTDSSDEIDSDNELNKAFDEKIKMDIHKLRVPFNSQHWIKLKQKLEAQALFRKKLYTAKFVELLVLTLLVTAVLNLWPIQTEIYQIPNYDSPMVASIPVDKATADKYEAEEKIKTEQLRKTASSLFGIESEKELRKEWKRPKLKTLTTKSFNSTFFGTPDHDVSKKIKPIKSNSNNSILFPFIEQLEINKQESTIEKQNVTPTDERAIIEDAKSVDDIIITSLLAPNRPMGYPDISLKHKANEQKEKTYLSLAFGPKVNLVNSPFDPVYEIDPYNIQKTNFNITAKVEKEIGPVNIYTGIGFTKTSYAPKRIVEQYTTARPTEVNETSLEHIKFETFNVPLGIKYDVVSSDKNKLFVSAGVALNVITTTDYQITDKPLIPRPSHISSGSNGGRAPDNTLLSQKDFNNGVFNGGSFRDNLYATASIGVGFERKISNHFGAFIEPKYSHFISSEGIGPNTDKVHSVSIDLGVRYNLN